MSWKFIAPNLIVKYIFMLYNHIILKLLFIVNAIFVKFDLKVLLLSNHKVLFSKAKKYNFDLYLITSCNAIAYRFV